MSLSKSQYITIAVSVLALLVLLFGCETKTPELKKAESTRAMNMEATGVQNILLNAKKGLSKDQLPVIDALSVELDKAVSDEEKTKIYKRMSSAWYDFGHPILAGHYAEEVAKLEQTEQSWSIAGTSYLLGVKSTKDKKNKDYASSKAIAALDNAISMNPDNVDHKINKALTLVENPVEMPMEGIMMLLDLNKQYPKEIKVLHQLARLGMRTNQWDKAIGRLTTALEIEPNNANTHCLLAEAYQGKGDNALASKHIKMCK